MIVSKVTLMMFTLHSKGVDKIIVVWQGAVESLGMNDNPFATPSFLKRFGKEGFFVVGPIIT